MTPELKKLLEIAGTLSQHKAEEKKMFNEVCAALSKLQQFCEKQDEDKVYKPLAACSKQLCAKLTKHLNRYK